MELETKNYVDSEVDKNNKLIYDFKGSLELIQRDQESIKKSFSRLKIVVGVFIVVNVLSNVS